MIEITKENMSINSEIGDVVLYWAGKDQKTGEPAMPVVAIIVDFDVNSKCTLRIMGDCLLGNTICYGVQMYADEQPNKSNYCTTSSPYHRHQTFKETVMDALRISEANQNNVFSMVHKSIADVTNSNKDIKVQCEKLIASKDNNNKLLEEKINHIEECHVIQMKALESRIKKLETKAANSAKQPIVEVEAFPHSVGDLVKPKSGGPQATIERIGKDGTAECLWFDAVSNQKTYQINVRSLIAISETSRITDNITQGQL